jgi:hypothetical protein
MIFQFFIAFSARSYSTCSLPITILPFRLSSKQQTTSSSSLGQATWAPQLKKANLTVHFETEFVKNAGLDGSGEYGVGVGVQGQVKSRKGRCLI